jgi:hypothetical protein
LFNRIPRHYILVFLLYLLVAIGVTYPVITSLSTQFLGGDTSDAYEMARHVWWFKTAIQTGEDIFWQSNLGYPEGFSGVTLWANPLQFFPMWVLAFILPIAMAYNITILLTMALNGWAMYVLARHCFQHDHHTPALIAGLIFMIFPVFQGHLFDGHAGLMVQWAVPLLIYSLFEYTDTGERRWFGWSVLFFLLSPSGHMLQIIYLLLPLMTLFLLARLYQRDYIGVTRVIWVGLVGGSLLLLYLSPVVGDTLQTSQYTQAGGYVRYSVDLLGIASPSHLNPFWHDMTSYSQRVLGINLAEGSSYIGVLGGLLALIGLLSKRASRWWVLMAGITWIFALGPVLKVLDQPVIISISGYDTIVPLPYALFTELPIFGLARTPGRFMFLFAVAFAMMAGYGMSTIWTSSWIRNSRRGIRYVLVIALGIFIFADYQFFDGSALLLSGKAEFKGFPTRTAEIPQAIYDLSERDDIRSVFNVPYNNLLSAKEALYLQTAHGKALIAGQVARETPVDEAKLALLQSFEPPLLTDAGVNIVIINKQRADQMKQMNTLIQRARVHLGDPIYEDNRYAIFENPISNAVPDAVYTVTPDDAQDFTYIYKEQPGWIEYTATFNADNRMVHLFLNDEKLHTWTVSGETALSLPLPIGRRGYNTFRIELDPPCPERFDAEVLVCRDVIISDIEIMPLTSGPIYDPIRIEGGIELAAFYMPDEFEGDLSVRLWWRFDQPRPDTDVRFIHVLDQNRRLMAQDDQSLGNISADTEWTETISLDLSDLPVGDYTVLTGWYASADGIRYDVLTNVEGAQDNTITLGTFTISE